jgi:hypothetical protein
MHVSGIFVSLVNSELFDGLIATGSNSTRPKFNTTPRFSANGVESWRADAMGKVQMAIA